MDQKNATQKVNTVINREHTVVEHAGKLHSLDPLDNGVFSVNNRKHSLFTQSPKVIHRT